MERRQLVRQRQPDARPERPAGGTLGLVEPVEDVRQVGLRNPRPGVPDDNVRVATVGADLDGDRAPAGRELERVREQVGQDRPEVPGIGPDLDGRRRRDHVDRDPAVRGERDERLGLGIGERAQVEAPRAEGRVTGLEARHVEDLVDEVEHAPSRAPRQPDRLGGLLRHRPVLAREHVVERAERERERRPELVADVGEEPAPGLVHLSQGRGLGRGAGGGGLAVAGAPERRGHPVERQAERADLVVGCDVDPGVEVARLDAGDPLAEPGDRAEEAPPEQEAAAGPDQCRRERHQHEERRHDAAHEGPPVPVQHTDLVGPPRARDGDGVEPALSRGERPARPVGRRARTDGVPPGSGPGGRRRAREHPAVAVLGAVVGPEHRE